LLARAFLRRRQIGTYPAALLQKGGVAACPELALGYIPIYFSILSTACLSSSFTLSAFFLKMSLKRLANTVPNAERIYKIYAVIRNNEFSVVAPTICKIIDATKSEIPKNKLILGNIFL
jgi:hypothetical protein